MFVTYLQKSTHPVRERFSAFGKVVETERPGQVVEEIVASGLGTVTKT